MKKNNKGFTLAELLIVVAIIAVLVAIAIPIFTTQLEKSREATDIANVRSAYATLVADYLSEGSASPISVAAHQTQASWQGNPGTINTLIEGAEETISYSAVVSPNKYTIGIDADGKPTFN